MVEAGARDSKTRTKYDTDTANFYALGAGLGGGSASISGLFLVIAQKVCATLAFGEKWHDPRQHLLTLYSVAKGLFTAALEVMFVNTTVVQCCQTHKRTCLYCSSLVHCAQHS